MRSRRRVRHATWGAVRGVTGAGHHPGSEGALPGPARGRGGTGLTSGWRASGSPRSGRDPRLGSSGGGREGNAPEGSPALSPPTGRGLLESRSAHGAWPPGAAQLLLSPPAGTWQPWPLRPVFLLPGSSDFPSTCTFFCALKKNSFRLYFEHGFFHLPSLPVSPSPCLSPFHLFHTTQNKSRIGGIPPVLQLLFAKPILGSKPIYINHISISKPVIDRWINDDQNQLPLFSIINSVTIY